MTSSRHGKSLAWVELTSIYRLQTVMRFGSTFAWRWRPLFKNFSTDHRMHRRKLARLVLQSCRRCHISVLVRCSLAAADRLVDVRRLHPSRQIWGTHLLLQGLLQVLELLFVDQVSSQVDMAGLRWHKLTLLSSYSVGPPSVLLFILLWFLQELLRTVHYILMIRLAYPMERQRVLRGSYDGVLRSWGLLLRNVRWRLLPVIVNVQRRELGLVRSWLVAAWSSLSWSTHERRPVRAASAPASLHIGSLWKLRINCVLGTPFLLLRFGLEESGGRPS